MPKSSAAVHVGKGIAGFRVGQSIRAYRQNMIIMIVSFIKCSSALRVGELNQSGEKLCTENTLFRGYISLFPCGKFPVFKITGNSNQATELTGENMPEFICEAALTGNFSKFTSDFLRNWGLPGGVRAGKGRELARRTKSSVS